jgi:osmotically-inducible protein OsmY
MSLNTFDSNPHDANLETAVRDALEQYAPLSMWKHSVQVRANAGTVTLSGTARSQAEKEVAENLVSRVKGVSTVQNQLIVDSDLELAVAQALVSDARTRPGFPGILVGVVFGVAYLKGTAPTKELKQAAGEIASQVAGVARVSNELKVPGN